MSSRIPELLDMLHTMITEAWGLPLGAEKCVIERDKALDLLDEIIAQFPAEIAEAKRLMDARNEFINNARREAETIKRTAEEKAKQLIDDQEVIRIARAKCNDMLTSAESTTTELRRVANEYVDDAMQRTEEALASALGEIRQSRAKFKQASRVISTAATAADGQTDENEQGAAKEPRRAVREAIDIDV
jgi:ATP-dependent Clp protease ATP-binding subunit ClpA